MIGYYKFSDTVQPLDTAEGANWIDLADPSEEELAGVAEGYALSASWLAEPLDPKEHPRVERNEAVLLIVIRLTADWFGAGEAFAGTVPVGIFIESGRLVTVCRQRGLAEKLSPLFGRNRRWSPLLLTGCIFRICGSSYIKTLEKLEDLATQAESRLRRRPDNDSLLELLNIQKSLIDLTVALKSDHGLLEKFHQAGPFGLNLSRAEKSVFEEALIETQQAVFTADIFNQVLASMSDAFGSVISNNLNAIMKFLAGVTIVLMLPTIIAGIYGMNVELPGQGGRGAFWLLLGLCLALMLIVSLFFSRKKWF